MPVNLFAEPVNLFPDDNQEKDVFGRAIPPKPTRASAAGELLGNIVQGPVGAGETLLQMGTALAGGLSGAAAGAYNAVKNRDIQAYAPAFHAVQEATTYQPRTEAGKDVSEFIGESFGKASSFAERKLVDPNIERGNPKAAIAGKVGAEGLMLFGPLFRMGKTRAPELAKPEATQPKNLFPEEAVDAKSISSAASAEKPSMIDGLLETDAAKSVAEASGKVADFGSDVSASTIGKSISPILREAEHIPSLKKIAQEFEIPEIIRPGDPTPPIRMDVRVDRAKGKFISAFNQAIEPIRTKILGRMKKEPSGLLWEHLTADDFTGPMGEVARSVRKILDDAATYAKDAGIDMGYLKGYVPRVYNKYAKSDKGQIALSNLLAKHGIPAEIASDTARNIKLGNEFLLEKQANPDVIFDAAIRPSIGRDAKVRRDKNLETSRTLARIPDAELRPFLETDITKIIPRYLSSLANRVEIARSFGPDFGKLEAMLRDAAKEGQQVGRPLSRATVKRITDIINAKQGILGDVSPSVKSAMNFALTAEVLRTMTFAVTSSLHEPIFNLVHSRPGAFLYGIKNGLSHASTETVRKIYHGLPKAEATRVAETLGPALDIGVADMLGNIASTNNAVSGVYFKANLLAPWTRLNHVINLHAGLRHLTMQIRDLANNQPTGTARIKSLYGKQRQLDIIARNLKEYAIDPKEAVDWYNRGASMADPFYDTYLGSGAVIHTKKMIMQNRVTNMALSASSKNPLARALWQLKKTQVMVGNTIMKDFWNKVTKHGVLGGVENAVTVIPAIVIMAYAGLMAFDLRQKIGSSISKAMGNRGKVRDIDHDERLRLAMDKIGIFGGTQFTIDASKAQQYGSSPTDVIAGPLISHAAMAFKNPAKAAASSIPLIGQIPEQRKKIEKRLEKAFK